MITSEYHWYWFNVGVSVSTPADFHSYPDIWCSIEVQTMGVRLRTALISGWIIEWSHHEIINLVIDNTTIFYPISNLLSGSSFRYGVVANIWRSQLWTVMPGVRFPVSEMLYNQFLLFCFNFLLPLGLILLYFLLWILYRRSSSLVILFLRHQAWC